MHSLGLRISTLVKSSESVLTVSISASWPELLAGESFLSAKTSELVSYFPDGYNGTRGQALVALFLKTELDELGVAMDEKGKKRDVHAAIAKLVDYSSLSKLSADGTAQFNQYAHGDFEALTEWFDDRPRSLETFLRAFKFKLDDALASRIGA